MNVRRISGLGMLVASLAAPAIAQQPTQVASARTPTTIEQHVGLKQPDAELRALIVQHETVEALTKEGKYDDVITQFLFRAEETKQYDWDRLTPGERKSLASIMSDIGSSYYGKGELEESIKFGAIAIQLDPSNQLYLRNFALGKKELGKLKNDRGFLDEAVSGYERVITANPAGEFAREAEQAIRIIRTKYLPNAK